MMTDLLPSNSSPFNYRSVIFLLWYVSNAPLTACHSPDTQSYVHLHLQPASSLHSTVIDSSAVPLLWPQMQMNFSSLFTKATSALSLSCSMLCAVVMTENKVTSKPGPLCRNVACSRTTQLFKGKHLARARPQQTSQPVRGKLMPATADGVYREGPPSFFFKDSSAFHFHNVSMSISSRTSALLYEMLLWICSEHLRLGEIQDA